MNNNQQPYIPAKTVEKLNSSHPKGTRHKAIKDIAISLLGNGFSDQAVFAQLRSQFEKGPDGIDDNEINEVIAWAIDKNPAPSVPRYGHNGGFPSPRPPSRPQPNPAPSKIRTPLEQAEWWLGSFRITQEAFSGRSPVPMPETRELRLDKLLELLYHPEEHLNIVCKFTLDADGKANPQGAGKILTAQQWREWIVNDGIPQSDAGGWMRPNPTKPEGSGKGGSIMDDDIAIFRFVMVEFDDFPIALQLSMYARLKLPIAAVLLSGGKSAHAWIRVDCQNQESYVSIRQRIYSVLEPFGIDPSNKNPSRLSRLAGAVRKIQPNGTGEQTLLWLNPNLEPFDEKAVASFEESLLVPAIEELPLRSVLHNASQRYEELFQNRGRLGIPTGIEEFDRDTGGLKNGQMVIVAAQTGIGKSTLAMNMINTALMSGVGVAMFSMEMDRDEICDILVSMNCRVNRNVFNTGNFSADDTARIIQHTPTLAAMPLWIFDEPVQTTNQMRARTMQLCAEGKIGLIVIDYIQFTSVAEDQRESREQQIAGISRAIRTLAKETKKPVVALSQLNDEGKIRESRVIAHDAHTVILLEGDMQQGEMKMRVVKGRAIPKKDYLLRTEPQYCRLYSAPLPPMQVTGNGWPA